MNKLFFANKNGLGCLFVLIIFLSLQSTVIAQHTSYKAGIGFSTIYQRDEINYYRDKLNHIIISVLNDGWI